jgi:lipid A 3-O-deacylase
MELRKIAVAVVLLFTSITSYASYLPDSASIAYGEGRPNSLSGARAAVQWDWNHIWFAQSSVNLTGYWDLSFAHWVTNGDANGNHKTILIAAIAPVLRLQTRDPLIGTLQPYIEASVGPSVLSKAYLGRRNLGAHWAFQDMVGVGVNFGSRQQFSLSYHYLHYSNANLAPPNNGIDVKMMLTFGYKFG